MAETRTPSLSKRIAKNTVIVLVGQALSLLANLAVTIMLAGHLGGAGFGKFSYALVFVSFFALIADFGMKPILVRELARQPERRPEIFGNAFLVKAALNLLAMLATAGAIAFWDFEAETKTILFMLTAVILLSAKLSTFRILFEALFQAQLRVDIPVLCQVLDAVILIVSLWALIHNQATLTVLTLAYVLSNLPGFVLTVTWSWRLLKPDFNFNAKLCRALLRESLPIFFYAILMACYDRIDVILLKALQGENSVGLYAAAFRLVSPLNFIPLALVTSLFPLMSQYSVNSAERLGKTYVLGMKVLGVIGLPLALLAAILGERIFAALYKPEFAPAANAFALLMCAQALVFWNFFLADFNTSNDRQKTNFWAALLMCVMNVALNLWLIPRWDSLGASAAKLLTNIAGFGVLFYLSYQKSYRALLTSLARLCGVAVLFGAWLFLAQSMSLLLVLGASLLVYPVLLLTCRVFDAEERRLFLRVLERRA
jgi:O-antigen/teichoic acid export membrane protein